MRVSEILMKDNFTLHLVVGPPFVSWKVMDLGCSGGTGEFIGFASRCNVNL